MPQNDNAIDEDELLSEGSQTLTANETNYDPNMLAGTDFPPSHSAAAAGAAASKDSSKTPQVQEAPRCDCMPMPRQPGQPDLSEPPDISAFYKTIDGELFIDGCATKFDLRHFNVLAIKDIQMVFVSTFQELYGAPFLAIHPQFSGKIFMT